MIYVVTARRDSENNMRKVVIPCTGYSQAASVAAALWNAGHDPVHGVYAMRHPKTFNLKLIGAERICLEDWSKDFYVEVTKNPEPGMPLWNDPKYRVAE